MQNAEHRRKAEELLVEAAKVVAEYRQRGDSSLLELANVMTEMARVHAILSTSPAGQGSRSHH